MLAQIGLRDKLKGEGDGHGADAPGAQESGGRHAGTPHSGESGGTPGLGWETLVRRQSTPQQVAARARSVLTAAAGWPLVQIAQEGGLRRESVRLWRDRWVALQ